MKDVEFRELSESERLVFERLLSLDFRGRDALAQQLHGLLAKQIDENGSLELRVQGAGVAETKSTPVVEASYSEGELNETNPIHVHVLLHVRAGKIRMLEVYKDDSSGLLNPINPDKFVLFMREPKLSS